MLGVDLFRVVSVRSVVVSNQVTLNSVFCTVQSFRVVFYGLSVRGCREWQRLRPQGPKPVRKFCIDTSLDPWLYTHGVELLRV